MAIGYDDELLAKAVTKVLAAGGGLAAVDLQSEQLLPLPVAGLMSDCDAVSTAEAYQSIDRFVRQDLGSTLSAPFMTLSFMSLLVIPSLKLGDRGLFDAESFSFTPVELTTPTQPIENIENEE